MKLFCGSVAILVISFSLLTACGAGTSSEQSTFISQDFESVASVVSSTEKNLEEDSSSIATEAATDEQQPTVPWEGEILPTSPAQIAGADLGRICIRVLDKNALPVLNARITLPPPDAEHMTTEVVTNALGQAWLNWPDANYTPYSYGNYPAHVKMNRPNSLAAVEEDVIFYITADNAKKFVDVTLKNSSTSLEHKTVEPRVEITLCDAQGNVPPLTTWLVAEPVNGNHPEIHGREDEYGSYIDEDGKVYFCNMPVGEYRLSALEDRGAFIVSFTFTVPEDETITQLDFQLSS